MPATSEKQAHLFQMAEAVKSKPGRMKGMPAGARGKIRSLLGMSKEKLHEFTHTGGK